MKILKWTTIKLSELMRNKSLLINPKYQAVKKYLETKPNLKVRIKK